MPLKTKIPYDRIAPKISFVGLAMLSLMASGCSASSPNPDHVARATADHTPHSSPTSASQAIGPGDTVICTSISDHQSPPHLTLELRRFASVDSLSEVTYQFSPSTILKGWTGVTDNCLEPTSWGAGFTKYLTTGTPPGAVAPHIALLDVRASTYQDLTEPRQQEGFSAPVLHESNPMFISDSPSEKVTFDSSTVLFEEGFDRYNLFQLRVDSPEVANPFPLGLGEEMLPGHPEYLVKFHRWQPSPGGAYFFENALGASYSPAANIDQREDVSCPDFANGAGFPAFLGWSDATHAVVADYDHADLVTIGSGPPVCAPLIPLTAKAITNIELSPDRSTLFFTATEPDGDQIYSVPANSPGTEPRPDINPRTWYPQEGESTLFYPGSF